MFWISKEKSEAERISIQVYQMKEGKEIYTIGKGHKPEDLAKSKWTRYKQGKKGW